LVHRTWSLAVLAHWVFLPKSLEFFFCLFVCLFCFALFCYPLYPNPLRREFQFSLRNNI
jgi:hypothetical protein